MSMTSLSNQCFLATSICMKRTALEVHFTVTVIREVKDLA